jgi:hypothetical protein
VLFIFSIIFFISGVIKFGLFETLLDAELFDAAYMFGWIP